MEKHSRRPPLSAPRAAVLAALVVLTGFGAGELKAPPLPRTGGVILAPLTDFPASLDPLLAVAEEHKDIALALYDTLMEFGREGELKGYWLYNVGEHQRPLASHRALENGRVWELRVRPGVKFHDGRELGAEDVAATLRRLVRHPSSPYSGYFMDILGAEAYRNGTADELEGVSVSDGRTVVITLAEADTKFLGRLGVAGAAVVPRDTPLVTDPMRPPPGTGPFRLRSVSESEIFLEYNPEYFNIRPYLDGIRFKHVAEGSADALIDFELGRFAFVTLPFEALWRFQHDARWSEQLAESPTESMVFLELGCGGGLDAPAVRLGLSMAVDRNAVVETLLNGRARARWTLDADDKPPISRAAALERLGAAFGDRTFMLAAEPGAGETGLLVAERIVVDLWKRGVRARAVPYDEERLGELDGLLRLWSPRGFSAAGELERGVEWSAGPESFPLASGCPAPGEGIRYPPYIYLYSHPRRVVLARGLYGLKLTTGGAVDFRNMWLDRETAGRPWREELPR